MNSPHLGKTPMPFFAVLVLAASHYPAQAEDTPIQIGPMQFSVNVMKNAMPKIPAFAKLTPKPGFVRGYVKNTAGKPLAGAVIGVRSTGIGGSYSGAQGKTDARGYYEVKVPWGAAHYYCAGYTVDYGEGRAALGLHPADGEADSFPSTKGQVENWVLLHYGIADRDEASEKPAYSGNYYGGSFSVDYQVADSRPLFADDYSLPANSEVELTLTPDGLLLNGSQGRSFVFRKRVSEDGLHNFGVNNVPIGRYKLKARLLEGENSSPLRIVETGPYASMPFGLEPKEARGQALLTFRPDGAKAATALAQHGNWGALSITLKK